MPTHYAPPRRPIPATTIRRADRLRQTRIEIRVAGSAFLAAAKLLEGPSFAVALKMSELSQWLLDRLAKAERRVSE